MISCSCGPGEIGVLGKCQLRRRGRARTEGRSGTPVTGAACLCSARPVGPGCPSSALGLWRKSVLQRQATNVQIPRWLLSPAVTWGVTGGEGGALSVPLLGWSSQTRALGEVTGRGGSIIVAAPPAPPRPPGLAVSAPGGSRLTWGLPWGFWAQRLRGEFTDTCGRCCNIFPFQKPGSRLCHFHLCAAEGIFANTARVAATAGPRAHGCYFGDSQVYVWIITGLSTHGEKEESPPLPPTPLPQEGSCAKAGSGQGPVLPLQTPSIVSPFPAPAPQA